MDKIINGGFLIVTGAFGGILIWIATGRVRFLRNRPMWRLYVSTAILIGLTLLGAFIAWKLGFIQDS